MHVMGTVVWSLKAAERMLFGLKENTHLLKTLERALNSLSHHPSTYISQALLSVGFIRPLLTYRDLDPLALLCTCVGNYPSVHGS